MRTRWQDDLVRIQDLERRVESLEGYSSSPKEHGSGWEGMILGLVVWVLAGYGLYKMLVP